jgi:hypothetical protein
MYFRRFFSQTHLVTLVESFPPKLLSSNDAVAAGTLKAARPEDSFPLTYLRTYLGMKFCTWVWNFVPGYEMLYLGMKFCTWVWNFVPGYEISYWSTKSDFWVRNLMPRHTFLAWVWNWLAYIFELGKKFHGREWNVPPGCEISWYETSYICIWFIVCIM